MQVQESPREASESEEEPAGQAPDSLGKQQ